MEDNTPQNTPPSLGMLVSGIIADTQKLAEMHVALIKLEVREDWDRKKAALPWFAVGFCTVLAVVTLVCFSAVTLLRETTQLPLSACFSITGLLVIALGAFSVFRGIAIWKKSQKN